ncbi:kelch-like protein 2 [Paramacrobiotus metropolitanus]|uniref:kelch-like protein 2 n=1 Tax=Paramacrobiotus metropolitanus TaxID=2943436 RepID=UPI002445CBF6|nr:kelch-like protein 2 [Paramacrobiotus metropolitanus]
MSSGDSPLPAEPGNPRSGMDGFVGRLRSLQTMGILCDVFLKGAEEAAAGIPCHRIVLSAHSTYFLTMFTSDYKESADRDIQLRNIDSRTLTELVTYAYTLDIAVAEENVEPLLVAALFLDFAPVVRMCWDFLESRLNASNCLRVQCLAGMHHNPRLAEKAHIYILQNFVRVAKTQDFLLINPEKIMELLASDNLFVETEDQVFEAVHRWIDYDRAGRTAHLTDVLQSVRTAFLGLTCHEKYFLDLVDFLTNSGPGNVSNYWSAETVATRRRPREYFEFQTVIVCVGGYDGERSLSTVDVFSPSTATVWRLANLPALLTGCGVAVLDGHSLFVCGGRTFPSRSRDGVSDVRRYDATANQWVDCAKTNIERYDGCTATLNGRIYTAGGYQEHGNAPMTFVEVYDPQTNGWQFVAELPFGLSKFAMVACGDRLYTFGGVSAVGSSHAVFSYDPAADVWSRLADMPTARSGCAGCVGPSGLIYVVGGNVTENARCVEAFNPAANQWVQKANMVRERSGAGAACVDGKVYVLGGNDSSDSGDSDSEDSDSEDSDSEDSDSIEVYDESSDRWTLHECRLPEVKHFFGCAVMKLKKDQKPVKSS